MSSTLYGCRFKTECKREDRNVSVPKTIAHRKYLQFSSYNNPGMKKALLRSPLARLSYISAEELKKEEFDHVMMVLQKNGYSEGCLKSWSKEVSSKTFRVVEENEVQGNVTILFVRGLSEGIH